MRRTILWAVLLCATAAPGAAEPISADEDMCAVEAPVAASTGETRECWYGTTPCGAGTCFYECRIVRCYSSGQCAEIWELGCYVCDDPPEPPRDRPRPPYET